MVKISIMIYIDLIAGFNAYKAFLMFEQLCGLEHRLIKNTEMSYPRGVL
jgi:hypothetical protein